MAAFIRKNPLFSLCGLNCCLCPRFTTEGSSRCPGCGGPEFSSQHPTCAVASCNKKHDHVEYCFQCSDYPCKRYQDEFKYDSFISYKRVAQNLAEAETDLEKYNGDLNIRSKILKTLLDNYNDGKSKGLYCLVANDPPLHELELLLKKIEKMPKNIDMKDLGKQIKSEITSIEKRLGIQFKLRKQDT